MFHRAMPAVTTRTVRSLRENVSFSFDKRSATKTRDSKGAEPVRFFDDDRITVDTLRNMPAHPAAFLADEDLEAWPSVARCFRRSQHAGIRLETIGEVLQGLLQCPLMRHVIAPAVCALPARSGRDEEHYQ